MGLSAKNRPRVKQMIERRDPMPCTEVNEFLTLVFMTGECLFGSTKSTVPTINSFAKHRKLSLESQSADIYMFSTLFLGVVAINSFR